MLDEGVIVIAPLSGTPALLILAQEESSLDSVGAGVTLGDGIEAGCLGFGVGDDLSVVVRETEG